MSDKLERFTQDARRALRLAQEEALRLKHGDIGPEHLLLGLAHVENGTAVQVLHTLGVEPGQVLRAVERAVVHGERVSTEKPTLTAQAKQAIELSVDEARLFDHPYFDTIHLLLGILRAGEGVAVDVLRSLGVNLDRVRAQTARTMLHPAARSKKKQVAQQAWVERITLDLTAEAEAGQLDPLVGRQQELERLIQILCRRTRHNPLLVGQPGVGKRALIEGLAQRMVEGRVPPPLLDRSLLLLDPTFLTPNLVRPSVEERMQQVLDECIASGALLFIAKLHTLVNTVGSSVGVAHCVKRALIRGDLYMLGTTTPDHYSRSFDIDTAHDWQLQPLVLEEPSPEEALAILRGLTARYEQHHQLVIADEALEAAVDLSRRFVRKRFLPDKAIDLLDEACSCVRIERAPHADALHTLFLELKKTRKTKEEALENQRFEEAIALRQQEMELAAQFDELRTSGSQTGEQPTVTADDIAAVVSRWTERPMSHRPAEEDTPGQPLGDDAPSASQQPE